MTEAKFLKVDRLSKVELKIKRGVQYILPLKNSYKSTINNSEKYCKKAENNYNYL